MENPKEELYIVVLKALEKETNDPDEVATALVRALALTLRAVQDVYGDRDSVKETARKTFDSILDML